MTLNVAWPAPIKVGGQDLHNTATFTYLGSLISQTGGTSNDICSRLNKARYTFNNLNVIWSSAQYSKETKLSIYQSCVLPILLYGSECWRMTNNDMIMKKLSSFHTKSLTKSLTLRIFWLRVISNKDLLAQCHQENMTTIIRRRRWSWIKAMCLEWKGGLFQKQQSIGHLKEKKTAGTAKDNLEKDGRNWTETALNYTWGTPREKHVTNMSGETLSLPYCRWRTGQ